MRIRRFHWSDYDAVVAVWTAAGREILPRDELAAKLTRDPELFLVAEAPRDAAMEARGNAATEAPGNVVAVVLGTYDGRRGWILRLAVHPDHRRRGVASRLVDELEDRFRRIGCRRVNLLVMPDNAVGLRFWQARGFLRGPSQVLPSLADADVILERRDEENLIFTRAERFEAVAMGLRIAARSLSILARRHRDLAEEVPAGSDVSGSGPPLLSGIFSGSA